MKNKTQRETKKVYKRKCLEDLMLIYYRMLLQRIARHLSTEEVAFLMGRPLDVVNGIDSLKISSLSLVDLFLFRKALGIEEVNRLFQIGIDVAKGNLPYELNIIKRADRVSYELFRLENVTGQKILEFKLIDARHDIDHYRNSTADEIAKIKVLVMEKIKEGYFDEDRSPYEIHKLCCTVLEDYIRPKNLMEVLDDLSNLVEERPRLVRKSSKYGYVYSLVLSIP